MAFDPQTIESFFASLPGAAGKVADTVTSLVPASLASNLAQSSVGRVTVRTAFSPAVEVKMPTFDSSGRTVVDPGDAPPSVLNPLVWLKPEIRIEGGALGTKVIAPYGSPDDAWQLRLLAAGGAVVALGALWWGAKNIAWKAALVGGGLYVASRVKAAQQG